MPAEKRARRCGTSTTDRVPCPTTTSSNTSTAHGHVQQHIEDGLLSYYTSGKRGLGLLYLDIDAHYRFQNDADRARELLQRFFPAFFRTSNRGINGYLKVRYRTITQFNRMADDLERTLKRLFDHFGILCDIEVKGTITTDQKSGRLAKLPFLAKNPEDMKDETDTWDFEQLARFQRCPDRQRRQDRRHRPADGSSAG